MQRMEQDSGASRRSLTHKHIHTLLHGKLPLLGLRGVLISSAVATPADWSPSQHDSSNNGLVAQPSCSMKEYWPRYGASGHRPPLTNTHLHTSPWAKLVFERWTVRAGYRATGHRRRCELNCRWGWEQEGGVTLLWLTIFLCSYWWSSFLQCFICYLSGSYRLCVYVKTALPHRQIFQGFLEVKGV